MNPVSTMLVCVYVGLGGLATILYLIAIKLENKENTEMSNEVKETNILNLTINSDMLEIVETVASLNPVMLAYYMLKTESRISGFNSGLVAYRIVYNLFKAQEKYTDLQVDNAIIALSAMYEQDAKSMQKDGEHEGLANVEQIAVWAKSNGFLPVKTLPIADMPHKRGLAQIADKVSTLRNQIKPFTNKAEIETQPVQDNAPIGTYPQSFAMFGNDYTLSDKPMLTDGSHKFVGGLKPVQDSAKLVNTNIAIGDNLYTVTKVSYAGKNLNLKFAGNVAPKQVTTTQPIVRTRKGKAQETQPVQDNAPIASTDSARIDRLESLMQAILEKL